jgi:hypothetical protein
MVYCRAIYPLELFSVCCKSQFQEKAPLSGKRFYRAMAQRICFSCLFVEVPYLYFSCHFNWAANATFNAKKEPGRHKVPESSSFIPFLSMPLSREKFRQLFFLALRKHAEPVALSVDEFFSCFVLCLSFNGGSGI